MTKIIALCGPAGSGKTTLADQLIDQYRFTRLSFAAPIKKMLATVLETQGVHRAEVYRMLYGDLKEEPTPFLSGQTPRYAMQTLGAEWRDLMAQNFWTNIWRQAAKFPQKIIVDDMRFLHEAAAIRELDGKIVRIERPGFGVGQHISEIEYIHIKQDFILTNDETPEVLLSRLIETGIEL